MIIKVELEHICCQDKLGKYRNIEARLPLEILT